MSAENSPPKMRDSDVIFLMVKRLEQCAQMMMRYDYGTELDDLMNETAEMFGWLANHMEQRNAGGDA